MVNNEILVSTNNLALRLHWPFKEAIIYSIGIFSTPACILFAIKMLIKFDQQFLVFFLLRYLRIKQESCCKVLQKELHLKVFSWLHKCIFLSNALVIQFLCVVCSICNKHVNKYKRNVKKDSLYLFNYVSISSLAITIK